MRASASIFRPAGVFPASLPTEYLPYKLKEKWDVSTNGKLLRFSLPEEVHSLSELGVLPVMKLRRAVNGEVLHKCYSPVSAPDTEGHVDLIVKRYAPRPGGGLGVSLSNMTLGNAVEMKLKAPRLISGDPYTANRFDSLVLIGNGTGVVPLHQLAREVLADADDQTQVWYIAQHRTELDVLLLEELKYWALCNPKRFKVHVSLSSPFDKEAWQAKMIAGAPLAGLSTSVGRLNLDVLKELLPVVSRNSAALVCGTDGFLEDVCGGHIKTQVLGSAQWLQGPVRGALSNFGFEDHNVVRL